MTDTNYNDNSDRNFSSSLVDIPMGGEEALQSPKETSYPVGFKTQHIRWTNILKEVETKETTDAKDEVESTARTDGSISTHAGKRVILDDISGEARPGEILALMGPSGSGKTSLMNVLSGRAAYQEGSISINGKVLDKAGMKNHMSQVAYVKQQDVFFEVLTVRDQLTYTAQLRVPDTNTTKKERFEKIDSEVNRILNLLRLAHIADSPIMMCSGGEKKRVNIATELLTDPPIILLDEPTSGLDSTSAVSLLNVLKALAKDFGKTIITSIHQPSSATFLNTFDKLMMLSDGKAVYFGTPSNSLKYLKTKGFPCPEGYNAADHWMDLLVADSTVEDDNGFESHPKMFLQAAWDGDQIAAGLEESTRVQLGMVGATNDKETKTSKYTTSWWTQYKTLTRRAFKKGKSAVLSLVDILRTIALATVVGIVYLNLTYTESDVFNIFAYFNFTTMFWVMMGMFETLMAFPQERIIINKERATASYRLSAYFCAMTTADIPVLLFMPFIFVVISYWMVVPTLGFTRFILVLLIALLSCVTGQGIGQFFGAAFDDIKIGQSAATVVLMFLMLLGGFFAQNIPAWLSWVRYISPFAYSSNAAIEVIFTDPIPCDDSEALGRMCIDGYASPEHVKDSFSVFGTVGSNVALLLVICAIPRLLAYGILRRKKAGERE